MKASKKANLQMFWGILLVLAGLGVFFRIPQVLPRMRQFAHFAGAMGFIYFCFYLLGVLLIVGGGKKIFDAYKKSRGDISPDDAWRQ